ncbi:MAG: hypothetical protein IJ390_04565, partial [Lachnospiraceae bacterium]|nr:hypothetical protein [Lachnospiraceae bacterium]
FLFSEIQTRKPCSCFLEFSGLHYCLFVKVQKKCFAVLLVSACCPPQHSLLYHVRFGLSSTFLLFSTSFSEVCRALSATTFDTISEFFISVKYLFQLFLEAVVVLRGNGCYLSNFFQICQWVSLYFYQYTRFVTDQSYACRELRQRRRREKTLQVHFANGAGWTATKLF